MFSNSMIELKCVLLFIKRALFHNKRYKVRIQRNESEGLTLKKVAIIYYHLYSFGWWLFTTSAERIGIDLSTHTPISSPPWLLIKILCRYYSASVKSCYLWWCCCKNIQNYYCYAHFHPASPILSTTTTSPLITPLWPLDGGKQHALLSSTNIYGIMVVWPWWLVGVGL